MKRNKFTNFVADNYVRLLPALVIAVAAGGLGIKYLFASSASTTDTVIITAVQDLTTGGAANDANSAAAAVVVRPGDTLQYTISVANKAPTGLFGGKMLSGVKVSDTLPSNMQLTTDASARAISLPFGDIPAGKTVTRNFAVKVLASAPASTTENIACYATTPQFFQPSEKGCDSAFVRVAPVVVAATPPAASPAPKPVVKATTPAPKGTTPTPAPTPASPSPAPVATAANCSTAADGTVKAGSAGADVAVPSSKITSVQIAYGTDGSNLDSKSSLTPSKGDQTTVTLPSLKSGTNYSYQIIRQCADGSYKTSDTGSFSTEKLTVNVIFTNTDSDPLEGISSSFSCAGTSSSTSDSSGMVSYSSVQPGDCKISYSYESKQCSNILAVPQPSLSSQISAADIVTLTYKVKACAEQNADGVNGVASKGGLAGNKAALIFGVLSLILAAMLVVSYLKQHRSNGGPGAPTGTTGNDGDNSGFVPPADMPPTDNASSAAYGASAAATAGYGADDAAAGSAYGYDQPAADSDLAATAGYEPVDQAASPTSVADVAAAPYETAPVATDSAASNPDATSGDATSAPLPASDTDSASVSEETPLDASSNTASATSADPLTATAETEAAPAAPAVDASAETVDSSSSASAEDTAAGSDDGSLDIPHQSKTA